MSFRLISISPNHHEKVLSSSVHIASLENLINVFLVIFSVFEMDLFMKLAHCSMTKRLRNVEKK